MGDGKALQMGTSHELGQNFARPFDITYASTDGSLEYVWQTSWGVSTRLIGGLIMGHGDDFGLRLPPALAPAQVVVLVVKDSPEVGAAAEALVAELTAAGHRVRVDARTDTSFGRRSVAWELKGVPVRVEVGPRDLAEGNVTVVTRHTREKQNVPVGTVAATVGTILQAVGPDAPGGGHGGPRRQDGGCRVTRGGHRGGLRRLRPGPTRGARPRRGGPPGPERTLHPVPATGRRLTGRARGSRGRTCGCRGPVLLVRKLL